MLCLPIKGFDLPNARSYGGIDAQRTDQKRPLHKPLAAHVLLARREDVKTRRPL